LSSPEVRIRTAEDLRAALGSADLGVRLAVLRSLSGDPTPALKLEVNLVELYGFPSDPQEAQAWAELLGKLPGADSALLDLLTRGTYPSILVAAAQGLSPRSATMVEPLGQLLLRTKETDRKRVVASLLVAVEGLDTELALLVSLWAQVPVEPPALNQATLDVWCKHLDHPRARAHLERQGAEETGLLLERWSSLSHASRRWLLGLAVERDWREWGPALLRQEDEDAVVTGLTLGAGPSQRWLDDARPSVRVAALLSEFPENWRTRLEGEADPLVRRALVRATHALWTSEQLVELIAGDDWELRALAADELARRPGCHEALATLDTQDPAAIAALHRVAQQSGY
jgi:hypothetical protein